MIHHKFEIFIEETVLNHGEKDISVQFFTADDLIRIHLIVASFDFGHSHPVFWEGFPDEWKDDIGTLNLYPLKMFLLLHV